MAGFFVVKNMSTISDILSSPPNNFSTTLSANISSSALTIPVNDTTGLGTEGVGVIFQKDSDGNPVTSSIEFIHWTGKSGNNLTLTDTDDRGISGSASGAQAHSSGDTFEVWVHSAYYIDNAITGSAGTADNLAKWNASGQLVDGPTLPSGDMVGTTDTQTLTNKTLTSPTIEGTYSGWVEADETWTYSAWDDTNGVSTATITVPSDATTKYSAGMRVKFDQTTDGTKYGIITKVEATALTVFINTDYDFDNETISNPYYSTQKAPQGFDLDPSKWDVEVEYTSSTTQSSPTGGTYYNIGNISIDIPVGVWNVRYSLAAFLTAATAGQYKIYTTLSTTTNSVTNNNLTVKTQLKDIEIIIPYHSAEDVISLSAKDTYYLLSASNVSVSDIRHQGSDGIPIRIRAVSAYL